MRLVALSLGIEVAFVAPHHIIRVFIVMVGAAPALRSLGTLEVNCIRSSVPRLSHSSRNVAFLAGSGSMPNFRKGVTNAPSFDPPFVSAEPDLPFVRKVFGHNLLSQVSAAFWCVDGARVFLLATGRDYRPGSRLTPVYRPRGPGESRVPRVGGTAGRSDRGRGRRHKVVSVAPLALAALAAFDLLRQALPIGGYFS